MKAAERRRAAEEQLQCRQAAAGGLKSEAETARLLHELEVHEIELEMQNEELQQAHALAQQGMAHYFEIFDLAPIGYFRMDEAGRVREANLAGAELLGEVRTQLTGRLFPIFVHGRSRPALNGFLQSTFSEQCRQRCEVELARESGPRVFLELTATIASDRKECLVAAVNISARREAEAVRESLEVQVRQSQKLEAVGELAGGIAHDFNNLLTVITTNAAMLQSGNLPPSASHAALAEISIAADHAASLTRQLLLFSRRQAPSRQTLDLNALVSMMGAVLKRIVGEKVELEICCSPEPQYVDADPSMLDQIVLNLTVNARDAMPAGGRVIIRTSCVSLDADAVKDRPLARPGDFCCLSVTDTGCGLTREVQEHMFEPFFTTKPVGQGSGLGLPTILGIVQQHQGWIESRNHTDGGAVFEVFLPRSRGTLAATRREKEPLDREGKGETILIVEDQLAVRRSLAVALSQFGYRVIESTSGEAALELWPAHRHEVQLLLTDAVMPGRIDGPALARKLRADRPDLPVIVMSGYDANIASDRGVLGEGVGFLAKPIVLDALLAAVRTQLDAATKS